MHDVHVPLTPWPLQPSTGRAQHRGQTYLRPLIRVSRWETGPSLTAWGARSTGGTLLTAFCLLYLTYCTFLTHCSLRPFTNGH